MSESGFPFGPRDGSELLSDSVSPVEETSTPGRSPVVLLGAGAFVVALGAAAAVFLGGGGDEATTEVLPSSTAGRVPAVAAPASPSPTAQALPAPNTESFARNPFKAQYVEPPPVVAASPVAVSQPLAGATPLPLTLGGAPAQELPQPAPTPEAEAQPRLVEYPITLQAAKAPGELRVLTWSIDGKDVEVVPGQRFGRHGELVVLAFATKEGTQESTGALLQVGDATPFVVRFAETVKVL